MAIVAGGHGGLTLKHRVGQKSTQSYQPQSGNLEHVLQSADVKDAISTCSRGFSVARKSIFKGRDRCSSRLWRMGLSFDVRRRMDYHELDICELDFWGRDLVNRSYRRLHSRQGLFLDLDLIMPGIPPMCLSQLAASTQHRSV